MIFIYNREIRKIKYNKEQDVEKENNQSGNVGQSPVHF